MKRQEQAKDMYINSAMKILELESQVSSLCESIKYTPYGNLSPLLDNIMMKKLELHRIRNQQKDIEYKFRTIGGLAI